MNPEIKSQWLAALRGDGYTQGRGTLTKKTPGGLRHCCLGVLCSLAVEAGVPVPVTPYMDYQIAYDGNTSVLPDIVMDWAGLTRSNPAILSDMETDFRYENFTLTDMNDGNSIDGIRIHSFAEIADLIERNL